MKLSVFIVMLLIPLGSLAQDSLARFRKPVAAFLIGEHYRAESLDSTLQECKLQKSELLFSIDFYQKQIVSYKKDSVLADSLLRIEKATGSTWKGSYELEKKDHKRTKGKVVKWKIVTVAVATFSIFVLIKD